MSGVFDRLDPDQLKAVRLKGNAAVSAGAGSGKTTVLAARYLRLILEEGADVRSVLCLTFTRKAAAEMRERIYRELAASPEARSRTQVERFTEAQISTIDSFCSLLLRSSAQDYGYAPDFAVDDPGARELAEAEALAFLLERREEPALVEVFARLGFERCWKELFADVAYRLCSPAGGLRADFEDMGRRARAELARLVGAAAVAAGTALHDAAAFASAAVSEAGGKACTKPREAAALCAAILPEFEALLGAREEPASYGDAAARLAALLAPLADFKLNGFGRSGDEVETKSAMREAREAALQLARLASAWSLAPLSEALLGVLGEFGERYRVAKRRAGIMSFRDAAVCAVDLLRRRKEIRRHWKRRFRFVMIDEFQDDDELQRDLLYLLGERDELETSGQPSAAELAPDKLFFVGDEKQSIYRFRGADVSVFRRLVDELAAPAAALGMNYRSEPALVDFFNELFSRVFADAAEDYEARFAEIGRRSATAGLKPELVYLYKRRTGDGGPVTSDDEALADGIATYIRDALGRLPVPESETGKVRGARPEDFAILLRSTAKQYLIERFLRLRRVPYAVDDPRGLFLESPANDIYAALRLCLLDDAVSYATVLRSPLVRLSDDGFARVLAARSEPFAPSAESLLDETDLARFRRGRGILDRLRSLADRRGAAELVTLLWYEEGLRLSILRKPDAHPYLEHFDYLLALAVRADAEGRSLASFVSSLEPLIGRPDRLDELEAPRESAQGVRIMTVHKAKGLEFPIVILPGMEGAGRVEGAGAAWYLSPLTGVTVNLKPFDEPKARSSNVFYDSEREREEKRRVAEAKRLFYVACTRASTHLVFAGVESDRDRGPSFHSFLVGQGAPDTDAAAAAAVPAAPGAEGGGLAGLPETVRLVELPELSVEGYLGLFAGSGPRSLEPRLQQYEAATAIDRSFERRTLAVSELNAAALAEAARTLPGETLPPCRYDEYAAEVEPSLFGELCHAVLESSLKNSASSRSELRALDALPAALRAPLLAEARALARRFLESDLGRLAAAASSLETEWSFLLGLGEGFTLSGRADLAFETGAEVFLVDFKTDRERRPGEYEVQLELYRRAASAIMPGKTVRSLLFWLRAGRAEELKGEHSEEELLRWARA